MQLVAKILIIKRGIQYKPHKRHLRPGEPTLRSLEEGQKGI
jgi:hypothetical protein